MPLPLLTALLWGTAPVPGPPPSPPAQVAPQTAASPARAPESDAARLARLRSLVEAAEKALEAEDEDAAEARADEADVLTADWPPELLKAREAQDLIQRLKEVQEQLSAETPETPGEAEPGLKAAEEVISLSGEELRYELEKVRAAEQGATYDFPIDLNDKVLTWVSLFTTTKRGFMENALGRASVYMPMIRQVFAEEGVPQDLAYLAVIESGFRNEAKSRAKAVGMWQFIRSTGRIYGLTGNAWIEERRDPVKSARAAARYLKRLYEISGDWYLAASGYNAGPLTLERAIQNVGTRNFWDLARSRWLRTETKNYVPELCAAILVGRNPGRYGLAIAPLAPYVYETVTVPSMTSLAVLARCAGTDSATLKALNPELLRGSTVEEFVCACAVPVGDEAPSCPGNIFAAVEASSCPENTNTSAIEVGRFADADDDGMPDDPLLQPNLITIACGTFTWANAAPGIAPDVDPGEGWYNPSGNQARPGALTGDERGMWEALGPALDVADPFPHAYTLEVSSPGLDRPFKRIQDYRRAVGKRVSVKLREPLEGQWRLVGTLTEVTEHAVALVVSDPPPVRTMTLEYGAIAEARLKVTW